MKQFTSLKKISRAFTLAEVLITLGIIGIVAALTIPTIISNSEKQSTVSKVKETYSILSQATTQINNDCGGDIAGCLANPNAADNDATERNEVAKLYKAKLSVIKDCTDGVTTGCFANVMYMLLDNVSTWYNLETASYISNAKFVLKNGASVVFDWDDSSPSYFNIYIDVNGTKGPNQLGKDTFLFYYDVNKKCLEPHTESDCGTGSNAGGGCSGRIIQEGAINYY